MAEPIPSTDTAKSPLPVTGSLKQPIVFDGTSTPVKAGLFVIVCLAWLLPGLIGRDPWKPDEAVVFGIIHNMLQGGNWVVPSIVGVPYLEYPPFPAWIGTLFATMLSPFLPLHDGARLLSAVWIGIAMIALARAATALTDERAGRISALMLIGSWGLLLRGHEISFALPPLTGTAIAFLGLALLDRTPRRAVWPLSLGSALVALSAGLVPALLVLAPAGAVMIWRQAWRRDAILKSLGIALAVTLITASIWPALMLHQSQLPLSTWLPTALGTQALAVIGRPFDPGYFLKLLPWYALPALPLACWLWWRDSKMLGERLSLQLPMASFIVLLIGFSLVREPRDDMALPLLVPLIVVAVQALDRLPRGLASFVDWFGMATFLTLAALLWSGWAGVVTGVPRGAARWAARQAPGYVHELSWVAFGLALLLTLIWMVAVLRTRRTNRRAIVNWCAGITLIWVLANLLWLPAVDHVRSYRSTASALKSAIPDGAECIEQTGLGDPQRAAFNYHAGLKFTPLASAEAATCNLLLLQGVADREPRLPAGWKLIWDGARPGDRAERFRLYQRR